MEKFLVKTKRSECDSGINSHSVTLNVDHQKSQDGDGVEQNQQQDTTVERDVYVLDDFQVPVERLSRDEYIRRGPIRPERGRKGREILPPYLFSKVGAYDYRIKPGVREYCIFVLKCTKTHLRASVVQKNF